MKSVKFRLISSIICLVGAIALASFTVFAWFTTNTTARTNGIDSTTTSGDVSLEVTCYDVTSITNKTDDDGNITSTTYTWDSMTDRMEDYTPRVANAINAETAIILEFKITYHVSGKYTLTAATSVKNDAFTITDEFNVDNNTWNNYLSNAIVLLKLCESENEISTLTYTTSQNLTQESFYQGTGDIKSRKLSSFELAELTKENLNKENTPDTEYLYYIMDYGTECIQELYTYLTDNSDDANLQTKIYFNDDIYFTISKAL